MEQLLLQFKCLTTDTEPWQGIKGKTDTFHKYNKKALKGKWNHRNKNQILQQWATIICCNPTSINGRWIIVYNLLTWNPNLIFFCGLHNIWELCDTCCLFLMLCIYSCDTTNQHGVYSLCQQLIQQQQPTSCEKSYLHRPGCAAAGDWQRV